MQRTNPQSAVSETLVDDPRWELVQRIVASERFAKSERLCSFLTHVCELSLHGREGEITEVNIGERLFGRSDYDPSIDGLVRSHASRMRQRLEQYFASEGAAEPIRLSIPKGAYVPVFEPQAMVEEEPDVLHTASETVACRPGTEPTQKVNRWLLLSLFAALTVAGCVGLYRLSLARSGALVAAHAVDHHPLWNSFFGEGRQSMVVCSDTSLATLEDLKKQTVSLSDYLNANYRIQLSTQHGSTADIAKDIGRRRYTSIADVEILTRFYQLPGLRFDRIHMRYARDVHPEDLKDGSAVLIGSQYSDPWVELFQPHMNFVFRDDPLHGLRSVINRSPQPGELPQYDYDPAEASHKIYGVVAMRPNLRSTGKVLILQGTSMAGTEAAADFVLDDSLLIPFLHKIRRGDGSLPYFEVLLLSKSIDGSASQLKVIGYRTSSD
jgi:hypothetical protein